MPFFLNFRDIPAPLSENLGIYLWHIVAVNIYSHINYWLVGKMFTLICNKGYNKIAEALLEGWMKMKLDNDRKKELQVQYKMMKQPSGIIGIINKRDNKYFLETAKNLNALLNSQKFKLNSGNHPNKGLQKDWFVLGEKGFEIEILEELVGDDSKDEGLEDSLVLLKMLWLEKLAERNIDVYS